VVNNGLPVRLRSVLEGNVDAVKVVRVQALTVDYGRLLLVAERTPVVMPLLVMWFAVLVRLHLLDQGALVDGRQRCVHVGVGVVALLD